MKIAIFCLLVLLCGCRSFNSEKKVTENKFPVDKTFNAERRAASLKLAQNYIDALNLSLKTGEFSHLQKMLPSRSASPRAAKIFNALKKRIDSLGTLESCTPCGTLDCTLFVDYLWKYRFVKPTGDPRLPQQVYEVLYRVRVVHPDKSPGIVAADFLFR